VKYAINVLLYAFFVSLVLVSCGKQKKVVVYDQKMCPHRGDVNLDGQLNWLDYYELKRVLRIR